jgi:thymidine kinase
VDEAQFLTKAQVLQLTDIVDRLDMPVLAYGLRSDFQGEAFEGSLHLLLLADNLIEIKTICFCGRKATMNARVDAEGRIIRRGEQVQIGGNESYVSMCRKHFKGL